MNRNRVRLRRKLRCNRYDHLGRRVQKITPEATHTYFYDGWLLVKEIVEWSDGTRRCGVSPRRDGGAGSSTSLGEVSPRRHGGAGVCTRWRDSSLICYNIRQDERTCI